MTPELSHRIAQAMMWGLPDLAMRQRIREAAFQAGNFDDLPDDIRQWVLDAETARRNAVEP